MWRPLLLLLCACDRIFTIEPREPPDAAPDAAVFSSWSSPRMLMTISTGTEGDPSITADGLELFFSRGGQVLVASRTSAAGEFEMPMPVPGLASNVVTIGSISPDGLSFWTPILVNTRHEIHVATRPTRISPFGAPVPVPELSGTQSSRNPCISGDGLSFVLSRDVSSSNVDLWHYTRASVDKPWTGRALVELNTPVRDTGPAIARSGLEIYFHTNRDGSLHDLYTASRPSVDDQFSPPRPVAEVNTTTEDELDAALTADGLTLVFVRAGNLYISTRTPL